MDTAIPIRTFVALELPSPFQREVDDLAAVLKPRFDKVRWTAAEVHLTLRFLGKALPDQLRRLEAPLRLAALSCPRAEIHFEGLGLFPERGSPRVLWLGARLPERVLALREECEAAAVTAGFPSEDRPFRPHLTLGRWRDRVRRPSLPSVSLGPAVLETLTVFRSELRSTGARYTPLLRIPLAEDATPPSM